MDYDKLNDKDMVIESKFDVGEWVIVVSDMVFEYLRKSFGRMGKDVPFEEKPLLGCVESVEFKEGRFVYRVKFRDDKRVPYGASVDVSESRMERPEDYLHRIRLMAKGAEELYQLYCVKTSMDYATVDE